MRRGGGFGMVILVVVLAVVLLLVVRSMREVAPTAVDVSPPDAILDDRGQTEAGDAVRSGDLPDLQGMQESTDAHAAELQDALAEIE